MGWVKVSFAKIRAHNINKAMLCVEYVLLSVATRYHLQSKRNVSCGQFYLSDSFLKRHALVNLLLSYAYLHLQGWGNTLFRLDYRILTIQQLKVENKGC